MRGVFSHTGQTEHHGNLAQAVKQSKMRKELEKREFLVAGSNYNFISKKICSKKAVVFEEVVLPYFGHITIRIS